MFSDELSLKRLQQIVGKSVYIYPRLHTSLPLLIKEIYLRPTSSKLRLKLIKQLIETLFDDYFFKDEVYQAIKSSNTRPKFLHIGLKFWELLGQEALARETKSEVSSSIIKALLTENFIKVFARSLSIQNGVLFEAARSLKASIIKMLDQVEIPADHSAQLIQTFFGPNTATKLAVKRN